ncbi:glycoside hydrolase family 9 protein [Chitinophaga horti]|uniref:Glycoside hydrolase family 9 protein n=1 Tax=Chitinophaga horti TaxID=2920382 RepID=A0ABY6IZ47_9BACT|nr:glycoside hydrolase family 9 protein [Chitinophaga horti]UYQ92548.1 glycoside hydrolase family 9 protein [Chitinophaga horti]
MILRSLLLIAFSSLVQMGALGAVAARMHMPLISLTSDVAWVRINQLGYTPSGIKVAVLGAKADVSITTFALHDAATHKQVYEATAGKNFGAWGPFQHTWRLAFTDFNKPGTYYIKAGDVQSATFRIGADVYTGTADFCLQYMRQQRCGYNPYLKDSCHTQDGFSVYGPMPDGTHIDARGGWHDATDYLQYVTTSANATYHLLAAYRDFAPVFGDHYQASGLNGKNKVPDVLDEARWGLDWLLRMHPRADWMFNQIADDRDHRGMRLPNQDTLSYEGPGRQRPVYFCTGEPQGLKKYMNRSTGVASTAGKFASAFALGASLLNDKDAGYAKRLEERALSAYRLGIAHPGVCQTAPCGAPYFYEEDSWKDDMELAAAQLATLKNDSQLLAQAQQWAREEPVTPWMGADTARHYQWYPFHNFGHSELATKSSGREWMEMYRTGIDAVWQKARSNAFYRGIPFIWCSNNLTASFAIQCGLYRRVTGDETYRELEQACIDWLFGCNPWGTSMVVGMPATGDTPVDPHSSFTHLHNYPVSGGLVDGPVYTSIYKGLLGITLHGGDEYAPFQSDLVVYHDDFGDYSTNEPTMDGTASMVYLLAMQEYEVNHLKKTIVGNWPHVSYSHGGIIRGDSTRKALALVFTGDEFADGGSHIAKVLRECRVKASFFLTGRFYRNPAFAPVIRELKQDGHYLAGHSDQHLLYCDWDKRDSLQVTRTQFESDLAANYDALAHWGVSRDQAGYFLPPYEWYNDTIASWALADGLKLVNFTPGTRSNADYTWPQMGAQYRDSREIYESVVNYEKTHASGLNGFMLLTHIGTTPERIDKFYFKLRKMVRYLQSENYRLLTVPELLQP